MVCNLGAVKLLHGFSNCVLDLHFDGGYSVVKHEFMQEFVDGQPFSIGKIVAFEFTLMNMSSARRCRGGEIFSFQALVDETICRNKISYVRLV